MEADRDANDPMVGWWHVWPRILSSRPTVMVSITVATGAACATRWVEVIHGSGNLLDCPVIMRALQLDKADDRFALYASDDEPVAMFLALPPARSFGIFEIKRTEALSAGEDDFLPGSPVANACKVPVTGMPPTRKGRGWHLERGQAIHGCRLGSRAWPLFGCTLPKDLR